MIMHELVQNNIQYLMEGITVIVIIASAFVAVVVKQWLSVRVFVEDMLMGRHNFTML